MAASLPDHISFFKTLHRAPPTLFHFWHTPYKYTFPHSLLNISYHHQLIPYTHPLFSLHLPTFLHSHTITYFVLYSPTFSTIFLNYVSTSSE